VTARVDAAYAPRIAVAVVGDVVALGLHACLGSARKRDMSKWGCVRERERKKERKRER